MGIDSGEMFMCTRYLMELSPELRPIIEEARHSPLAVRMRDGLAKKMKTEGEVRPADMVPVMAPDKNGRRKSFPMVWGFTFSGLNRPVVNARSETADSKPAFRESFRRRRCIIPAAHYYEWDHIRIGNRVKAGTRYTIQPRGMTSTWLAGLYRMETSPQGLLYPVFTILTREPSEELRRIHDRMPVILATETIPSWLDLSMSTAALKGIIDNSLTDMVIEK